MTIPTVLIADDDRSIRTVLTQALGRSGYQVRSCSNAATLWRWVEDGEGDLVITDVVMPDENGLDLIPRIRRVRPDLRVVVMSAQSTLMTAVKAAQRGAFEYLPKPFDLKELLAVVGRALAAPPPLPPPGEPIEKDEKLPLIGRSVAMQEIYRSIARLTTADLTVMVTGESGTGKELVARALHDYGRRRAAPFVAINMAAIPRELIESELFGHERGAFTGAHNRNQGRFEQAAGGTLFLDEIGDMPHEAQTRLLRVLQEGEFTTVGGRQPIKANVRIVAATHRDLRQAIRGRAVPRGPVLPPQRRAHPPAAAAGADRGYARACPPLPGQGAGDGLPGKSLDAGALERMRGLPLARQRARAGEPDAAPGRAVSAGDHRRGGDRRRAFRRRRRDGGAGGSAGSEPLAAAVERHIKRFLAAGGDGMPMRDIYDKVIAEVERPLIQMTLSATRGNQIKAAAMLGLNRNTLRKKIRDLDIAVVRGIG